MAYLKPHYRAIASSCRYTIAAKASRSPAYVRPEIIFPLEILIFIYASPRLATPRAIRDILRYFTLPQARVARDCATQFRDMLDEHRRPRADMMLTQRLI